MLEAIRLAVTIGVSSRTGSEGEVAVSGEALMIQRCSVLLGLQELVALPSTEPQSLVGTQTATKVTEESDQDCAAVGSGTRTLAQGEEADWTDTGVTGFG